MIENNLYAQIPLVRDCIPGCTDCCGPVPFSKQEAAAAFRQTGRSPFFRHGRRLACGYAVKGRCAIYEVRPLICRLVAASQDPTLKCPYGIKADRPLSIEETRALTKKYDRLCEVILPEPDSGGEAWPTVF